MVYVPKGRNATPQKSVTYSDKELKDAVLNWSIDGFTKVRQEEQAGNYNRTAEILENYISNKSEQSTLYRGVVIPFDSQDFSVGDVIDQKGTSSWTKSAVSAESFANTMVRDGIATVFVLEKGTNKGANISDLKGTGRRRESEILISKKSKQKVKKIEKVNGKKYIYLDEI